MTLLVLGKNRRTSSRRSSSSEFQEEFKTHLSLTYGKQHRAYTSNEKIEIGEARLEPNKDVTVRRRASWAAPPATGCAIDYRLRETTATG